METKQKTTKMAASLLALVGIVVFSLFATAGDLEPDTGPAPTMKTIEEASPGTLISDLPCTITKPGYYYCTRDATSTWHGIIVNCDTVTIDFKGFSISGTDTEPYHGIYMDNRKNIEIRGGTIRDFGGDGIVDVDVMHDGREIRIINMRLIHNGGAGISIPGRANLVKDCVVTYNGGAGLYCGYNSIIVRNIAYTNGSGGISGGNGCIIKDNNASYNRGYAGIAAGVGCVITGNVSSHNGNGQLGDYTHGIDASFASTVIGNCTYWNQGYGILFNGGQCLVDQNTAYNNNKSGLSYENMETHPDNTYGTNHAPPVP